MEIIDLNFELKQFTNGEYDRYDLFIDEIDKHKCEILSIIDEKAWESFKNDLTRAISSTMGIDTKLVSVAIDNCQNIIYEYIIHLKTIYKDVYALCIITETMIDDLEEAVELREQVGYRCMGYLSYQEEDETIAYNFESQIADCIVNKIIEALKLDCGINIEERIEELKDIIRGLIYNELSDLDGHISSLTDEAVGQIEALSLFDNSITYYQGIFRYVIDVITNRKINDIDENMNATTREAWEKLLRIDPNSILIIDPYGRYQRQTLYLGSNYVYWFDYKNMIFVEIRISDHKRKYEPFHKLDFWGVYYAVKDIVPKHLLERWIDDDGDPNDYLFYNDNNIFFDYIDVCLPLDMPTVKELGQEITKGLRQVYYLAIKD